MNTVTLSEWHSPASDYPRRKLGRAEITTSYYPRGAYHCYTVRGYDHFQATRRLSITTLQIDGKTWMVDDPPHWWAMEEHAAVYHGHVLCAGLGLGLMVHALDANPDVTQITVVEREADVIGLVAPLVPSDKLTIVHDDFFEVSPQSLAPVDGVLFDLFVGDGRELFGPAVRVGVHILQRWPRAGADDFALRVHGLPNPLVAETAAAIVETETRYARS